MSEVQKMELQVAATREVADPGVSPHALAAEAAARAMVEARYVIAFRRPRNWDAVRVAILRECSRPSFALDKSALYKKPVGGSAEGVDGLGIRFVEMALRCMTNILVEQRTILETDMTRVLWVAVTDLEANVTFPREVTIEKTVERSRPSDDGYISVRTNSRGQPVYRVRATEDEVMTKEAAIVSKIVRMCGLRVIPGDLQAEAEDVIRKVRADRAAADPDGERKAIVDGFASLNVPIVELAEYVGHDLGACSPAELGELRSVWGAIRDGETTWANTIAHRRDMRAKAGAATAPQAGPDATSPSVAQRRARPKATGVAGMEANIPQSGNGQAPQKPATKAADAPRLDDATLAPAAASEALGGPPAAPEPGFDMTIRDDAELAAKKMGTMSAQDAAEYADRLSGDIRQSIAVVEAMRAALARERSEGGAS